VIERAAVVVVAIAAAAFLAVGLTAARAEDDLFNLPFRTQDPDVGRAEDLAGRAGRATPGERRTLLLARVRQDAGDAAGAVRDLRGAVRREPDNAEAWLLLSRAAEAAGDAALAGRAAQRVGELAPSVPEPSG
jgi:cytochrome c-type biogenesis protein CcmH/NrfG